MPLAITVTVGPPPGPNSKPGEKYKVSVWAELVTGDTVYRDTVVYHDDTYTSEVDLVESGRLGALVGEAIAKLSRSIQRSGARTEHDVDGIVEDLAAIMTKYGNSLAVQMVAKLRKAKERPAMLGKAARDAWGMCMKNPESASKTPGGDKTRAEMLMMILEQVKE